jgi:hypothetical protein
MRDMKKLYDKHLKKHVEKVKHHVHRMTSKVKKKHIRVSIAVALVVFGSVVSMMIVYRGYNFPINWFSIVVVSVILAAVLGTIEYLYITRVKGY